MKVVVAINLDSMDLESIVNSMEKREYLTATRIQMDNGMMMSTTMVMDLITCKLAKRRSVSIEQF
jgi:hypothetical protein